VLALMAEGLSNKEMARRLKMTTRTVEFHVGNILRKLGVASRVEAVVRAKERGMTP
jgi:DNA-binding NarL/FixJ family response regulator